MTSHQKRVYLWGIPVLALLIGGVSSCGSVYLRLGTTVVGSVPSPDGRWDAVLMVRNGGAATDFSTQVSVIRASSFLARQAALCRPGNAFIADANHGVVSSGAEGQMDVAVNWNSNEQITIIYPKGARIFKQSRSVAAITIEYAISQ